MKIYTPDTLPSTGRMVLLYGDPGVGKTESTLMSAPRPLIYLPCEPRNPTENITIAKFKQGELLILVPENWNDLIQYLSEMILHPENIPGDRRTYKTVFLDGASHLMNVSLSGEIEDEAFDARDAKDKMIKPLVNQAKLTLEGYGSIASQMNRLIKLIGRLSADGMVVVVTALVKTQPKWDRDISVAPNFKGREFNLDAPGSFDAIGYVQTRRDGAGNILYPPLVSFREGEGYQAKWCGQRKGNLQGPLDIGKILAYRDKVMKEMDEGKGENGSEKVKEADNGNEG